MSAGEDAAPEGPAAEDLDGLPLAVRDYCLVTAENEHLEEAPAGLCVSITVGDSTQTVPVIPIVVIGGRLLVAVPSPAWHRSPLQRLLPPGALVKPTHAAVAGVIPGDPPSQASSGVEVKVWVAYASAHFEAQIRLEDPEDVFEPAFADSDGQSCMPYSASLIKLADDHCSFLTAESEAQRPIRGAGGRVDRRVAALEESIGEIRLSLAALLEQRVHTPDPSTAVPKQSAMPKQNAAGPRPSLENLDRGVVASARAAGIPDEHLVQMAKLLKAKPRTIGDLPAAPVRSGPLSETEDEDPLPEENACQGGASGSGPSGSQMEKAVLELTKIAKTLTASRKDPKPDLEALLGYGMLGDKSETSSSGTSRRNSAALMALRKAVRDSPHVIYESLERNLREDFGLREALPGEPQGQATVRSWLQSRSRVQNYTNHVRWMWQLGAIWDCLIQDRVPEARARVGLLMAAGEQSSIDSGSWLISTVSLLEGPPPYQQFSQHQAPAPHELQHSALYDPRWFELFLWQLKEQESYQEARRKLTQKRGGQNTGQGDKEVEAEKPEKPPRFARPKGKAKNEGAAE